MKHKVKDAWNIAEGMYGGHRIIVRQNVGARPIAGNGHYPFRAGIAIPFRSPQKDGTPSKYDITILERIEDLIYDYFDTGHTGVLCLVLTTQGMREFIVYSTTDDIADLTGSLSQHFRQYDIQHYAEPDKDWDVFKQWDSQNA